LSKEAVDFIETNKDRPFFLYYPTTNIHVPHTPKECFKGKSTVGKYGDFVAEFDWAVGEILSTLDRLQLTENTLVIITSDNGAWMNPDWTINNHKPNGNWRGEKATIYEGGHRIPFIARWPGNIQPDTVCDEPICLTDLMSTCADLMGEQLPVGAGEDSVSILPVLLGKELYQPLHENIVHHSVSGMFAVRKGPWKLIDGVGDGYRPTDWPTTQKSGIGKPEWDKDRQRFKDVNYFWPTPKPKPNEPPGQLYNLETDPGEIENVWEQYPEVVKQLKRELDRVVRS
jgi:arylsulfatase A-like enzyme